MNRITFLPWNLASTCCMTNWPNANQLINASMEPIRTMIWYLPSPWWTHSWVSTRYSVPQHECCIWSIEETSGPHARCQFEINNGVQKIPRNFIKDWSVADLSDKVTFTIKMQLSTYCKVGADGQFWTSCLAMWSSYQHCGPWFTTDNKQMYV